MTQPSEPFKISTEGLRKLSFWILLFLATLLAFKTVATVLHNLSPKIRPINKAMKLIFFF